MKKENKELLQMSESQKLRSKVSLSQRLSQMMHSQFASYCNCVKQWQSGASNRKRSWVTTEQLCYPRNSNGELQCVADVLLRSCLSSDFKILSLGRSESFALATCAPSHHFQFFYNSLSSTLIYTTSIFKFDANSSKKFQTATLNQQ